jgi:hypothetical protein
MYIVIPVLIIVFAFIVVIIVMLLGFLAHTIGRLQDTNKQLMILVAGKEAKPETLRALVASQKPPQGKLKGIATEPVKKKEPSNKDFTLNIGGTGGI